MTKFNLICISILNAIVIKKEKKCAFLYLLYGDINNKRIKIRLKI
jgi:hypothetical protein